MKYVYVAGSISATNPVTMLNNIRRGIDMGAELLRHGLCPFIPFLDFQIFLSRNGIFITEKQIKEYSLKWLEKCDAILVLPESDNSIGTQAEIRHAGELDIPIFYSVEDLLVEAGILFKTW